MIVTTIKRVAVTGNALAILITKEAEMAKIKKGDFVKIMFEKVNLDESNLHDNSTAQQDPEARMERNHQDARHPQMDYRKGNGARRL